MARKDPVAKAAYQKEWLAKKLSEGYGKRLYARRKLHRENAVRFKIAIERALDVLAGEGWEEASMKRADPATLILYEALQEADAAEAQLQQSS